METIPNELLTQQYWRLNNLYYIKDKYGRSVKFQMNSVQAKLFKEIWYCNIILKARQLGISTLLTILFTDLAVWNPNLTLGIIAQTREDSESLFRKVKHAYDNLPLYIKDLCKAKTDSARELVFNNGSSIRVGQSMRGSTLQYLHISEYGKICAQDKEKANEILTGSLNTVATGQYTFIESTAEGREGIFYEMCKKAQSHKETGHALTPLDYRFHFFPWYLDPSYVVASPLNMTEAHHQYFLKLSTLGVKLLPEQKYWYTLKESSQKENMKREYPSTPEEAWEVSNDGSYYSKYLQQARAEHRICKIPYDPNLLVHVSLDLGYNDFTAVFFFQVYGKEVRLINYMEDQFLSMAEWCNLIKKLPYTYGEYLAPHDAKSHSQATGFSSFDVAFELGITLTVLGKIPILEGIEATKSLFHKLWIDEDKCAKALVHLENYKRKWNNTLGCWGRDAEHDEASHCADALRYLATGLYHITGQLTQAERERQALESMRDRTGMLPGSMFYESDGHKSIF